jgi:hypothetical protein
MTAPKVKNTSCCSGKDFLIDGFPLVLPFEFDFGPYKSIVELGGGQGELVSALAKAYKNIKEAIVVDLESVISVAPKDHPLVKFQVGSFFDASTVPMKKDLYLIWGE